MLLRTTLLIALTAPLLTNCSAVFKAIDGQTPNGEAKESPLEAPRAASVLGNPVEEGPTECVPKSGYGQTPTEEEETDYPTEEQTPPAGDTGQNQSDEPEEETPTEDEPSEEVPSEEDPGKTPVEDCK